MGFGLVRGSAYIENERSIYCPWEEGFLRDVDLSLKTKFFSLAAYVILETG